MEVEEVGEHNDQPNAKRIKRMHAQKYAASSSAAKALLQMEKDKVPENLRPSAEQLKNFRPSRAVKDHKVLSVDSLQSLKAFCEHPPEDVVIDEQPLVLTETEVRIVFHDRRALEKMKELKLSAFLCDYTLGANIKGLTLGAIGPVALHQEKGQKPSMRFLPVFFALSLSRTEDSTAHTILFRTYVAAARRSSICFFDCAVLQSAVSFFQSAEYQDPIALHRCLQHTKSNVRWAAKTRHEGSGETRLRNTELLGITIEFLHWSVPSLHRT